ncbi:helix-turn-helix domain-containing protein [Rhodomicrobium vannielii ATCC 17100]|uniref:helix-turn-helix domain-containing protein n=1 Tax=Rhodomicrobium vannielii TaxID=1069 RepID=UPI00191B33C2|nr:helix-turn-helix domain-containing protein [Rhodomicrobium vannielii]MBJ7533261.1 helix-turn-helix domain-containing protein [Rhodomicrobium vannielii ATCC 17100]
MARCDECRQGLLQKTIKLKHEEDLGGIVVHLLNSVQLYKCTKCDYEEVVIPDLEGLAKAVALVRALMPMRLSGGELKFIRKTLDMTQKEFAEKMDLAPETLSRWENNHPGTGEYSEKLLRHNVCAFLYKDVLAVDYDPAIIANLRLAPRKEPFPPIEMRLVKVKDRMERVDAWDQAAA